MARVAEQPNEAGQRAATDRARVTEIYGFVAAADRWRKELWRVSPTTGGGGSEHDR